MVDIEGNLVYSSTYLGHISDRWGLSAGFDASFVTAGSNITLIIMKVLVYNFA